MKEVIILQHVPNENAGTILHYLERHKIPYRQVNLFESGYQLPELKTVRSLVVMGGPMNVYEEKKHPFLIEENRYIQRAMAHEIPYLGICLGAQLLAKALNAKVYKAQLEEIGWDEVELTPAAQKDALFAGFQEKSLKVLQWHGDTFDMPLGASLLASGRAVQNQAFALKGLFYGLQFHIEVNKPMLEDWFAKRDDLKQIVKTFGDYREDLAKITERFYRDFFALPSLSRTHPASS